MVNFFFFVVVIGVAIYFMANYFLQKQKRASLEELYQEYQRVFDKFNSMPKDIREFVVDINKRLVITLKEIEQKYQNYKNDPDILLYVKEKKVAAKELERQIIDHKRKWEIYDKFLNDVGYTKLNIENLKKDIAKRADDITITFGDDQSLPKEKEELIKEETEKVMVSLDSVYRIFEALQLQSYPNFDVRKLNDSEVLLDQVLRESEQYYHLLKSYKKEIQILLIAVSRHSIFYLKLKELLEGYKSGRNKTANLGEVPVSYQTFEKMEEGSKYRQDVFVTSKRVGQEIAATYFIKNGPEESYFEDKLTYDELLDLLSICKLQPTGEEIDENKIAYNFNLQDLSCEVALKEKNELLMKYKRNVDVIKRIPVSQESG